MKKVRIQAGFNFEGRHRTVRDDPDKFQDWSSMSLCRDSKTSLAQKIALVSSKTMKIEKMVGFWFLRTKTG
jgi:hypothetical protein